MMRLPILIIACLFLSFSILAEILERAKWTFEESKKNVKAGEEIELIFKAKIDDNWYLYSNDFDPDCGPLLTEIVFTEIKNFEVSGVARAINSLPKHDEIFDCDVKIFKKTGEFRQKIKVLG